MESENKQISGAPAAEAPITNDPEPSIVVEQKATPTADGVASISAPVVASVSDESKPASTEPVKQKVAAKKPVKKATKKATTATSTSKEQTTPAVGESSTITAPVVKAKVKSTAVKSQNGETTSKPIKPKDASQTTGKSAPKPTAPKSTAPKQSTPKQATTKSTSKPTTATTAPNQPATTTTTTTTTTQQTSEAPPSSPQQSRAGGRQPYLNLMVSGAIGLFSRLTDRDSSHESGGDDHYDDDNDDDGDNDQDDKQDDNEHDDADNAHDGDHDGDHDDGEHNRDDQDQSRDHENHADSERQHDIEKAGGGIASAAGNAAPARQAQTAPRSVPQKVATANKNNKDTKSTKVKVTSVPSDLSNDNEKNEKVLPAPVRPKASFTEILVKSINVIFPLFFITIGILHIVKVGRSQSDPFATAVQEVNTIAITLWPIMFAAIATQSLRAYGALQAERGIKLVNLEQLLHSTSFSSALKQPLLLRRIDWMSVILFVLWGLSPLASQGLQRMPYVASGSIPSSTQVAYSISANWRDKLAVDSVQLFSAATAGGALITPYRVARSPQDLFGYPKIPIIDNLGTPDANGIIQIPDNTSTVQWSSLLGVLHSIDPQEQSAAGSTLKIFNISTAYYSFACTAPQNVSTSNFDKSTYTPNTSGNLLIAMDVVNDGSSISRVAGTNGTMHWAIAGDQVPTGDGSGNLTIVNYIRFDCSFKPVPVSVQINCTSRVDDTPSCATRYIKLGTDTSVANPISVYPFISTFVNLLPTNFALVGSLQQSYLQHPNGDSGPSQDLLSIDPALLSVRVAQLINTAVQSGVNSGSYLSGLTTDVSNAPVVPGTITNTTPVWQISIVWTVFVFVCTVFILCLAVADILWESRTISPNFLGFASNLVRSNQQLRKEFQGLSGHERTRAMAEMKVMLQDINADGERGKIVLGPKNTGAVSLRRGRHYA